ncbi:hypothetical protein B7494_g2401 [Chlorociboria aeruginascens]|nr:hypothetical protein B7494_g2401 [Chlorociboria aeruginascens]
MGVSGSSVVAPKVIGLPFISPVIVVEVFALLVIVLCTIPAFITIVRTSKQWKNISAVYEDEDGVATAEIAMAFASTTLPRKPNLFKDGLPVVTQKSGTALGRYTFSYCEDLIALAKKKNTLDMEDLPKMDFEHRSRDLSKSWDRAKPGTLSIAIFRAYGWRITFQIFLSAIQSGANIIPSIAIFNILTLLESRGLKRDIAQELWTWVASLALSSVIASTIEICQDFYSWTMLSIPIRAQLSALIFEKTLRRKDVKEASSHSEDDGPEAFDPEKTRQSTINLIGVDSQRIGECFKDMYQFGQSPIRIVVSISFLLRVLSWQGLLVGFSFLAFTYPINKYFSDKFFNSQTKLMKIRDYKAAIVGEALQGLRQVKFSAEEDQWEKSILDQREIELVEVWNVMKYKCGLIACFLLNPLMSAAISLGVHAWLYEKLTSAQAFTAIGIFLRLDHVLQNIPEIWTRVIIAWVSISRIEGYLGASEVEQMRYRPGRSGSSPAPIVFDSASISWPSDEKEYIEGEDKRFVLRDVNIAFPVNELTILSGRTGSGKSLLLASILGEVELLAGSIKVPEAPSERYDHKATKESWILPTSIAFVAQIPWIENGTVKQNILFGLPLDTERYNEVLEACALTRDVAMLIDGDETEIGHGGINMSGGQRWRITLARALYSRAGILLLDDIFSAVDVHVGRFILNNALKGKLCVGRTCILATHHLALCKSHAKLIVELDNGTTKSFASFQELERSGSISYDHLENTDDIIDHTEELDSTAHDNPSIPKPNVQFAAVEKAAPLRFVEEEFRREGNIGWPVYIAWFKACGGRTFFNITMFLYIVHSTFNVGRTYWLRVWTDDNITMLFAVLRTPLRWIDTVPLGRILNRFTADFNIVDTQVADEFAWGLTDLFKLFGIIAAGLFLSPYIIIIPICISLISVALALHSITAARAARRLESVAKSPIFEQFGLVLIGITTIRAFQKQSIYLDRIYKRFDDMSATIWSMRLCHCWLILRVSLVGSLYTVSLAAIIAYWRLEAGLAGFVLAMSVEYSSAVFWTLYHAAEMEMKMNSTERVIEYGNIPTEDLTGNEPPAAWPTAGCIEVSNLVVAYNHDLPPVLKGLDFNISRNERVGIIGRTGCGKSTLTLALFRFLQAREGSIIIDGQDISKLKLQTLRRRLAIIPQDPVLFSDTANEYDDSDLFDALRRVHLIDASTSTTPSGTTSETSSIQTSSTETMHAPCNENVNLFTSLSSQITEGGLNLSQGQRQLLCLARAIVRRPKILVLDEATSSVDVATDALIQRSIREEFVNSTLMVIAHRLSTVGDFDKVLVMDNGFVQEFGSPAELIERKGMFWEMVRESGEIETLVEMSRRGRGF